MVHIKLQQQGWVLCQHHLSMVSAKGTAIKKQIRVNFVSLKGDSTSLASTQPYGCHLLDTCMLALQNLAADWQAHVSVM